jgi:hypothetical protein
MGLGLETRKGKQRVTIARQFPQEQSPGGTFLALLGEIGEVRLPSRVFAALLRSHEAIVTRNRSD